MAFEFYFFSGWTPRVEEGLGNRNVRLSLYNFKFPLPHLDKALVTALHNSMVQNIYKYR